MKIEKMKIKNELIVKENVAPATPWVYAKTEINIIGKTLGKTFCINDAYPTFFNALSELEFNKNNENGMMDIIISFNGCVIPFSLKICTDIKLDAR